MAYKACYRCELLFEVDETSAGQPMPCPQCGAALEDYVPEAGEALPGTGDAMDDGDFDEDQATVMAVEAQLNPVNPAIVSTHAFDGLSAAVREQLSARQGSPRADATPAPPVAVPLAVAAPVVAPVVAPPMATPVAPKPAAAPLAAPVPPMAISLPQPVGAAPAPAPMAMAVPQPVTPQAPREQLGAMAAAAMKSGPAPGEAEMVPTQALESVAVQAALDPAPRGSGARHSLAAGGDRHTRIEGMKAVADPPPAAPVAPAAPVRAPFETPPPVQRTEQPAPPLDPLPKRRSTVPPPENTGRVAAVTPAPPATAAPAKKGGGGKVALIVVVALVVLGGGGGAAWWFLLRPKPTTPGPVVEAPKEVLSPAQQLDKTIAEAAAELPDARAGAPVADGPWLVGGGEALSTSAGSVPGLPSLTIPDPLVESDAGGEWIGPLKGTLEPVASKGPLLIALDQGVQARAMSRFAYSAYKAGSRQFGVLVKLGGERGTLPFSLYLPDAPLPDTGAAIVRIGTIGLHLSAKAKDGTQLTTESISIPRKAGDALDLDALDEKLDALATQQSAVKAAIVYSNPELPLAQLVSVLDRVRAAKGGKERFPQLFVATTR